MAETRDLNSIIQIDGTDYKVHAVHAESADSATKVEKALTITQANGTIETFDGSNERAISIPKVNNNTLTIQTNGINVATFTANSDSDVIANITVPTITITDDLDSTSSTAALSANQGRVLDEKINTINTSLENLGGGDMLKSVYVTNNANNNNKVDKAINAEQLGGVAADGYQVKLVSSTNIKTINNQSLLGEGNIEISGGGGTSDVASKVEVTMDGEDKQNASITIKSSDPSGGATGDIWFKY